MEVFSIFSSSFSSVDKKTLMSSLIHSASALQPMIPMRKSSAYLTYLSLLKVGSLCTVGGVLDWRASSEEPSLTMVV